MASISNLYATLSLRADNFNNQLRAAQKEVREFQKTVRPTTQLLNDVGRAATSAGRVLTVGVTAPLVAASAAAVKFGVDAVESENLFEVSMKGMADSARAWSQDLSRSLGLNQYEVRKNVGVFFNMFDSMKLGETAAYDMATALTELSFDMASFFNISQPEAFQKLQSGISGEIEPLRRLGVVVDETTLKTQGYLDAVNELGTEITQQDKILARFLAIMDQTNNAQGDLARTLDSPANKMRILRTRFEETATALGIALLPAFNKLLDVSMGLARALESVVTWFSGLSPGMQTAIIAAGALAAALGPALLVLGQLSFAASSIIAVWPSLMVGFSGLAGIAAPLFGAGGLIALGAIAVGALAAKFAMSRTEITGSKGALEDWNKVAIETEGIVTRIAPEMERTALAMSFTDMQRRDFEDMFAALKEKADAYQLNQEFEAREIDMQQRARTVMGLATLGIVDQTTAVGSNAITLERYVDKLNSALDEMERKSIVSAFTRARDAFGVSRDNNLLTQLGLAGSYSSTMREQLGLLDETNQKQITAIYTAATLRDMEESRARVLENVNAHLKVNTREAVDGYNEQASAAQRAAETMREAMANAMGNIISDMSRGIARAIVEWEGFGNALKSIAKNVAESMLASFLAGLLSPLTKRLADIGTSIAGVLTGVGVAGGAAGAGAAAGAAGAGGAVAGAGAGGFGGAMAGLLTNPFTIAAGAALGVGLLWRSTQAHHKADEWVQGYQNPFDQAMARATSDAERMSYINQYFAAAQSFAQEGSDHRLVVRQAMSTFKSSYSDLIGTLGVMVPQFAKGTPMVERDTLGFLHRGEAVVTASDNEAFRDLLPILKDMAASFRTGDRRPIRIEINGREIIEVLRDEVLNNRADLVAARSLA